MFVELEERSNRTEFRVTPIKTPLLFMQVLKNAQKT